MTHRPRIHLVVREGGRAELGRRMLRAYQEHRHAEGRALVERIAHRACLRVVAGGGRDEAHSADGDGSAALARHPHAGERGME